MNAIVPPTAFKCFAGGLCKSPFAMYPVLDPLAFISCSIRPNLNSKTLTNLTNPLSSVDYTFTVNAWLASLPVVPGLVDRDILHNASQFLL
eukprot:CAMPEP_0172764914 /NCGR_PEP_ID=MMETSP1074-20121228/178240_1 /TAXON_ID=2916 /ORGANISM="Ceratium fusus, Strain PA161109" /LENGTH=90 /DNA_ID=CAMNT_0013599775 /DNA_START=413 /DNA_END=682 /DNA_ORIENTATION=+